MEAIRMTVLSKIAFSLLNCE